MLITITENSVDAFENMAEKIYLYPLEKNGHYCIGAVDDLSEKKVSQGILIFDVSMEDSEIYAQLSWLYVAEQYRSKGIGEELMNEFYRILNETGVKNVYADIPFPEDYDELCAFLEDWGFDFELVDDYTFTASLSALSNNPVFTKKLQNSLVRSLREINSTEWKRVVNYLDKNSDYEDFDYDIDLYEVDISCVIFRGSMPIGMFLVKANGAKQLEPAVLSVIAGSPPSVTYQMLLSAFHAAQAKYGQNKEIYIKCKSQKTARLIDYFFKDAQPSIVRSGRYVSRREQE